MRRKKICMCKEPYEVGNDFLCKCCYGVVDKEKVWSRNDLQTIDPTSFTLSWKMKSAGTILNTCKGAIYGK